MTDTRLKATAAELAARYFETCEARGEKPKTIYAAIERHSITAKSPAGTMHTWSLSRADINRYAAGKPWVRIIKITTT